MMPEMNGFEFLQAFKSQEKFRHIPVIVLTAVEEREEKVKALSLGADDFLLKPVDVRELSLRIKNALELKGYRDALQEKVDERTKQLKEAYEELKITQLEIVRKLGRAAEFRDDETGKHIIRMSNYVALMAEKLGKDREYIELILYAAPMHDIGKIGIPDRILLKPGKLTPSEFEVMKMHTTIGAEIIGESDYPVLRLAREIALTHHEKWDGSGYPAGLKGKDIPLSGRMVAIADVFDALTSDRIYRKAWSVERAVDYIRENRGKHFDPELVDLFLNYLEDIIKIKEAYKDKKKEKPFLYFILERFKYENHAEEAPGKEKP